MPRKIVDIEINEITLCKSPANRKKFFIQKMHKEAPMLTELKKFMAEDEDKLEDVLTEDEIKKAEALPEAAAKALKPALEVINEYKDNMPDDILGAVQTIIKHAALDYPEGDKEVSKAGAKLSKSTIELIKKALAFLKDSPLGRQQAIDVLSEMLGEKVAPAKKTADGEEKLSADTLAKLERLEELEDAEKNRIEKAEAEKAKKAEEEKKDLLARLEALEAGKPIKKSIDGPEGDKKKDVKKGAGDEDDVDHYPSIPIPIIE